MSINNICDLEKEDLKRQKKIEDSFLIPDLNPNKPGLVKFDDLLSFADKYYECHYQEWAKSKPQLRRLAFENIPGLNESFENLENHFANEGIERTFFRKIMRTRMENGIHGVVIQKIIFEMFSYSIQENEQLSILTSNEIQDKKGTDFFIKKSLDSLEVQVKAGEINKWVAEEIMNKGKMLVEVHFDHNFDGLRTIRINRQNPVFFQGFGKQGDIKSYIMRFIEASFKGIEFRRKIASRFQ